jgi:hypothetical protein
MGIEIREKTLGQRLYEAMQAEAGRLSWRERMDLWAAWRNGWEWSEVSPEVQRRFAAVAEAVARRGIS